MVSRRLISKTSLAALSPEFARIRSEHGVVEEYPPVVIEALPAAGIQPWQVGSRTDLTDLDFVTIDPPGAQDLDQAMYLTALPPSPKLESPPVGPAPDGAVIRVYYAIADVSSFITPGSDLDRATHTRGETIYCPDKRIGLHPAELAEGLASLLPQQKRPAVVWELDVDVQGNLIRKQVYRAWVRSRAQYSYAELQDDPARAGDLVPLLQTLGARRRAWFNARGAVTLPKPSQEITQSGDRITINFRQPLALEDDNAQVSLLTGVAAAEYMLAGGLGILRTMPAATEADYVRLRRRALALGLVWPEYVTYGEMLVGIRAQQARGAAFLNAAVQLFRGAAWEAFDTASGLPVPENITHGALGVAYAHVTAPLRRLVDRYGLEVCLAISAGEPVPEWARAGLDAASAALTQAVRVSKAVDRDCIDVVESALLEPHVGEQFRGIGLDDRTLQLSEPAVIARCRGGVVPGQHQTVRLVEVGAGGPIFEVVDQ